MTVAEWITEAKTIGLWEAISANSAFGATVIAAFAVWLSLKTRAEVREANEPRFEITITKEKDTPDGWFQLWLEVRNNYGDAIVVETLRAVWPPRARLAPLVRNEEMFQADISKREVGVRLKLREAGRMLRSMMTSRVIAGPHERRGDIESSRLLLFVPGRRPRSVLLLARVRKKGRRDRVQRAWLRPDLPLVGE